MIKQGRINHKEKRKLKNMIKLLVIPGLLLTCAHVFAEGTDLLAGTEADLVAVIKGTGKTYLYVAELIVASFLAVKTRNPGVFLGVLGLAAGFNILLKMAGV